MTNIRKMPRILVLKINWFQKALCMVTIIEKLRMNTINKNFKGLPIICSSKIDITKKLLSIKKIYWQLVENIEETNDATRV
jgi:hypothetical protein